MHDASSGSDPVCEGSRESKLEEEGRDGGEETTNKR